jgi:hypothetical protein
MVPKTGFDMSMLYYASVFIVSGLALKYPQLYAYHLLHLIARNEVSVDSWQTRSSQISAYLISKALIICTGAARGCVKFTDKEQSSSLLRRLIVRLYDLRWQRNCFSVLPGSCPGECM